MSKIINCAFSLIVVLRICHGLKEKDNIFYSFKRYCITFIKMILVVQLKNDIISKKMSYINVTRFVGSW